MIDLHPICKLINDTLFPSNNRCYSKVSSDRIVVQLFFCCSFSPWNSLSHKRKFAENHYDIFKSAFVFLTSLRIFKNPLREIDGEFYQQSRNRLFAINVSSSERRHLTQNPYRKKRKCQMNIQFWAFDGHGTETEIQNHWKIMVILKFLECEKKVNNMRHFSKFNNILVF